MLVFRKIYNKFIKLIYKIIFKDSDFNERAVLFLLKLIVFRLNRCFNKKKIKLKENFLVLFKIIFKILSIRLEAIYGYSETLILFIKRLTNFVFIKNWLNLVSCDKLIFFLFSFYFLSIFYNKEDQKLTEWEEEFEKEREKEEIARQEEIAKEEEDFQRNRRRRRYRRKIAFETIEYCGEKYHPDDDTVWLFIERFQDDIWRTVWCRQIRIKIKILLPFFISFMLTFIVWLVAVLNDADALVYQNNIYIKIKNQFVFLPPDFFEDDGDVHYLTIVDWVTKLVTRYKMVGFCEFEEVPEKICIVDIQYNWFFLDDIRTKRFPFYHYNRIFYDSKITICTERIIQIDPNWVNNNPWKEKTYIKWLERKEKMQLIYDTRHLTDYLKYLKTGKLAKGSSISLL